MKISVEYPITERIIIKTKEEALAMGYSDEIARINPVNRKYKIQVNTGNVDVEAMCENQTGTTAIKYQKKYGVAWNE